MKKIFFGTAGWSYPDWEGIVYPSDIGKKSDRLSYISNYIDVIEINSTFYHPPSPKIAMNWVKKVEHSPDFKFSVKLSKVFTHERIISINDVKVFTEGILPLKENGRLASILIQFPWSFKYNESNLEYIKRVCEYFYRFPLVLEIRHNSWNIVQFYQFLSDSGIGFCNIDQPIFYQSLKPTEVVTSPVGYVRLHGQNYETWFNKEATRDERYDYLYSEEELLEWLKKIKNISKIARETYVIANNHYKGKALVNILQMKKLFTGKKVPIPKSLILNYPFLNLES